MEYLVGFMWLIFAPAFNGYLSVPASGKPAVTSNCSGANLFTYHITPPYCHSADGEASSEDAAPRSAGTVLSSFESAAKPGRFLGSRCNNLITRRANHTGTFFELKKSESQAKHFHLVHSKTRKTLVVNSAGQMKFVEPALVAASCALQRAAALRVVAVKRMPGNSAEAMCEQHVMSSDLEMCK